ncbi:MAG TPA: right-handed parallel beta-helix repeat-containing protein [Gaiellales bacterium]|nr:right-handed parallel beta-helix repeat-containing protein [Gaiellales bacterium]
MFEPSVAAAACASGLFDVKDYGAVGDGMTDDSAALQAAYSALPDSGGALYFPPGNYLAQPTILTIQKPNVAVVGAHRSLVKLTAVANPDNTSDMIGVTTPGAAGFVMCGVTLDSGYPTRPGGNGIVITSNTSDVRIHDCGFLNIGYSAIGFNSLTHGWFERNYIHTCGTAGIRANDPGPPPAANSDIWIVDNQIIGADQSNSQGNAAIQTHGILGTVRLQRRFHILNNTIDHPVRVGIGLDQLTGSIIHGNTVFGPHGGEAMAVSGARNRITGNDLADSTGAAGLLLWCGKAHEQSNADTLVTGNLIHDNHPNQGIAIVPAEDRVTVRQIEVTGNRCWGQNYGLQLYTSGRKGTRVQNVLISNNHLVGNRLGAYTFFGLRPVLRGNLVATNKLDA